MNNGLSAVLTVPILFFSVIVHECAHGYVALRNGDPTAKDSGRLTLNPLPHIDPFGTILLPLTLVILQARILFGWAKPVPVNPLNFKDMRSGLLQVAVSGPLSNIALSFVCALALKALLLSGGLAATNALVIMFSFGIQINAVLAVFNLLPIPPLDGSMILVGLLPGRIADQFRRLQVLGFLGIVLIIATPLGYYLIWLPAGFIIGIFSRIAGIPFVF
ncbi:MAG: site-2 protease family protein [Candidatus Eisenbacteria bacterium]|nr:site-2 protease family protein [Candidatus Eisenbacteria bacterium]